MDTLQINKVAQSSVVLKHRFAGTFPCDKLPTTKLDDKILPQYFVINSCEATINSMEFCHWCALIVYRTKIIFFDSSGLPSHLSNKHIREFIELQGKDVEYSSKPIQGFNSNFCGMFCLTFLYCMALGISLKKYLRFFRNDDDLDRNDRVVMRLFKKAFLKK